jgi:SM-20-related protein
MFKGPQKHEVLPVAKKVKPPRLSITGWLRMGEDPGPG